MPVFKTRLSKTRLSKAACLCLASAALLSACAVREAPSFPVQNQAQAKLQDKTPAKRPFISFPGKRDAVQSSPQTTAYAQASQNNPYRYVQPKGTTHLQAQRQQAQTYQAPSQPAARQSQKGYNPSGYNQAGYNQAGYNAARQQGSAYAQPTQQAGYNRAQAQPHFIRTRSGQSVQVFTHLVQQGETTYSLSKKYCSDINDIRSLNALTQDYKINVGQSLMVPRTRC